MHVTQRLPEAGKWDEEGLYHRYKMQTRESVLVSHTVG